MSVKLTSVAVALILVSLTTLACQTSNAYKRVSLSSGSGHATASGPSQNGKLPLRVAIAGVISPKETIRIYRELVEYLGQEMGRPVEIVQRSTYAEINELVRAANIDVAFVCSEAYVQGNDEFGMELLAVPEVRSEVTYYSYIIVPNESVAQSLEDLRGKTFAFSDPLSNSGRLSPTYALHQMGETPDSFFKRYVFTYSHDNSIKSVAEKLVDGAAVDSLVYDYTLARNPRFNKKTRIIQTSGPYGIPPVVVHPGLNPQLKSQLQTLLLTLHQSERGESILQELFIDRFVQADDRLYDPVRQMLAELRQSHDAR